MEIDKKNLQFKHPFTSLISGPTGSGKTFLIRRILKNFKLLIYNFNNDVLKILWAYGQWQQLYNVPISNNVIVKYIEEIPKQNIINEFQPNIIVIDDLLNEFNKNNNLENLFIKKSHHSNISVIFVVQNLFHKSIRTISLNSHYIILLKNPRDKAQIGYISKQIFPDNPKVLMESFLDATSSPYGYLVIDLTQETPENYRLRTRITPEELTHLNKEFSPIIYKIK
jgi:hypothetical protein